MPEDLVTFFSLPEGGRSPHLLQALTHPSFSNERREGGDNQRLEFLGDAVLQLCASEYLYREHPDADEGELTRRRARLVNSEALAEVGRGMGLEQALRLGKGAEAHGLRSNTSVLADAVEALIAAAYLDAGMDAARGACVRLLRLVEATVERPSASDAKSELQEVVQARGLEAPIYRVEQSGGPAHDPWFEVSVLVSGTPVSRGRGRSKRQAERKAAELALERLPAALAAIAAQKEQS